MITVFFQQALNGIILGSLYMLVALGLFLIFGILEVTNFAHGEFYMLGAFATLFAMTGLGVPFLPAVVLAMLCMAAFGVLVECVVFRPIVGKPLINGMLLSFGLSTFLTNLALLLFTADPRKIESEFAQIHLRFLGLHVTLERLLVLVVGAALVGFLAYFIQHTQTGKAMRAVAQDRIAAQMAGIPVFRIYAVTFAIGSMLASAAGSMVGAIFLVSPDMGWTVVLKAFIVGILGGMGNIGGIVCASLFVGLVESLSVRHDPWRLLKRHVQVHGAEQNAKDSQGKPRNHVRTGRLNGTHRVSPRVCWHRQTDGRCVPLTSPLPRKTQAAR